MYGEGNKGKPREALNQFSPILRAFGKQ